MTITPNTECLYGGTLIKGKLIGGMLCRVISMDGDEARCQAVRTGDEFTVNVSKLRLNETEGT